MNIFEFKAPGGPDGAHHFFIDLEAIQVISGLTYKEEKYQSGGDFGPGSGGISGGYSSGKFTVTLALRTDIMTITHGGIRQIEDYKDRIAFAKEKGFPLVDGGIARHSPEMKQYADHLNKLADPFVAGRAFKAEHKRLVDAWKACKSTGK